MKRAMAASLAKFEQDFAKDMGQDTIRRTSQIKPYEVISTGSLMLDDAMGVGGLIEGRLVEYWGQDGTGKTTLALIACANAQKKYPHKLVAYVDMEQSLDLDWAVKLGVNLDYMWHVQPNSAEDVADAAKRLAESGHISLIVVDSIGGMVTAREQEKDADDSVMGKLAQVVTRMVKILAVAARQQGVVILLVNQVRANLSGFGRTEQTGGGWALKHGTTHRVQFKRTGMEPLMITLPDGAKEQVGVDLIARVEKNKVAPPRRSANFTLLNQSTQKFGPLGVDIADEAVRLGEKLGIYTRSGAWYTTYDGERFNGRAALVDYFRECPALIEETRKRSIESHRHEVILETIPEPEAASG